jgi:hypothetical protein
MPTMLREGSSPFSEWQAVQLDLHYQRQVLTYQRVGSLELLASLFCCSDCLLVMSS